MPLPKNQRRRRDRLPLVVAAILVGLGLVSLLLSSVRTPSLQPKSQLPELSALINDEGDPVASTSTRASPASPQASSPAAPNTSSKAAAPPAAPPPSRQPAPLEAAPVAGSKAIVGSSTLHTKSPSPSLTAADTAPFSVVVSTSGDPQLDKAAGNLVSLLKSKGYNASTSTVQSAGAPNALLLLTPGPAYDVWYCNPGPALSASLAVTLSTAFASLPVSDATQPRTPLACDQVQAARPSSAAALVEMPVDYLAQAGRLDQAVAAISSGLSQYFTANGTAIRSRRLVWPATGPITSFYGPSHPLGIDIGEFQGSIVAATDGVVTFAGGDPCCSYGYYVTIQSPDGIETLYAHFSQLAVTQGQKVRQGQRLGEVGCTGHCTGPHLHFEVIDNGVREDPLRYLP